ncbi:MAG: sulfotransferase [Acidocella sp.]|nr:sulfotransferase [Acidocella sp.]
MNTQRIHIIGPPRSGTTLMHTLFSVCMGVDGVTSREERIWRRMPHGERVLVTKCPGEERFARPLLKFDRDLWFVFMLRDPRDLIVSQHGSEPGRYWSNLRTWYEALAVYELIKGHPRFIVVRYEDLVRTPDKVQQNLLRRLPFLQNAVPFSRYQEHIPQGVRQSAQTLQAMRGIRAVSSEHVGAWRQHLPRVKAHISRYPDLPAWLINLGYEQDTGWLKALERVPADNQPSVVPDNLPLLKRCRHALRFYGHLLVYLMRRYAWAGQRQA